MPTFPIEKLKPLFGILDGRPNEASIEITLERFELAEIDETISTSVRLDLIVLPSMSFSELSGRTFEFPSNPDTGYIDGSIYIEHAHHPVDVSRISFGSCVDDKIAVELEVTLVFDFEGLAEYSNTGWVCCTHLQRE